MVEDTFAAAATLAAAPNSVCGSGAGAGADVRVGAALCDVLVVVVAIRHVCIVKLTPPATAAVTTVGASISATTIPLSTYFRSVGWVTFLSGS